MMTSQIQHLCPDHPDLFDCPDVLITYTAQFDEYGLIIHDGGSSCITISFCPWCGTRLPKSKYERWRDELAALGFDEPSEQAIPDAYNTDAWYREKSPGV